jgi:hypothetical protein
MRRALPWIVIACAFAAAAAVRYLLVEPEGYGFLCESGGPWWCRARDAVIVAFHSKAIGWLAAAAAVVAFAIGNRALAVIAAALGACGLILYNYDLSAVAFVLAVLILARAPRDQAASTGTA